MLKIEARPYKIIGRIQNYEWGTKDDKAYIPKFLGMNIEPGKPYAEYWIGVHPKAPAYLDINNENVSLKELIEKNPETILGKRICKKFNNTFPFLLKILSINQALSIQAHPDKVLAEVLNKKDPANYPDDNHKPEIAIAIDHLQAIVGLKEFHQLKSLLKEYNEIEELLGKGVKSEIYECMEDENIDLVKKIYAEIMHSDEQKIIKCIESILARIHGKNNRSIIEEIFLTELKNYGYDVGLLSLLLFNFITLDPYEAIFTPAGIPHAYLKGNIIECMANSDNVVRAGLTPKFKDIDTLVEMLDVDSAKTMVDVKNEIDSDIYKTPADEFQIERITADQISINDNEDLNILLVLDGEIRIKLDDNSSYNYKTGDVILIPAVLSKYNVSIINKSALYMITVPKI